MVIYDIERNPAHNRVEGIVRFNIQADETSPFLIRLFPMVPNAIPQTVSNPTVNIPLRVKRDF
jgi:hypothetical protein